MMKILERVESSMGILKGQAGRDGVIAARTRSRISFTFQTCPSHLWDAPDLGIRIPALRVRGQLTVPVQSSSLSSTTKMPEALKILSRPFRRGLMYLMWSEDTASPTARKRSTARAAALGAAPAHQQDLALIRP